MPRDTDIQTESDLFETAQTGFDFEAPAQNAILLKASSHVIGRITCREMSPLNANELKSVNALLAYVAYNQQVEQETVQAVVEARFGVDQVEKLPQKDYEEVIRFLVDLSMDEILQ